MHREAWSEVRIGDLGEVFTGRTPSTNHPAHFGDEYPFITPSDMHQGKYARATERGISLEGAALLERIKIPANSICVSCIGWQMGEVIMTAQPSFTNQQINTIVPNSKVEPSFLYYSLRPRKQELLSLGSATGVRTPILNKSAFCDLKVRIPPISIQRRIAGILSAYDDLIENNTRRITIVEQMAQMLYREWFVNFRFPCHDKVKMVDSELGQIPNAWRVIKIGELLTFHIGGGWGEETKSNEFSFKAHVIRGTDIPQVRVGVLDGCPSRFHKESNLAPRKLVPWDIVLEVSGGSKGQPVGRALLVHPVVVSAFEGDVMCASFCKLLRVDPSKIGIMQFYQFLLESYANGQIEKYQVQSTGITNFKFAVFLEEAKVTVPPASIREEFERLCQPLVDSVVALGRKNAILRSTRDLLLPKLVSGEISVEQLETEVAAQKV